jgi:hypothetical protein
VSNQQELKEEIKEEIKELKAYLAQKPWADWARRQLDECKKEMKENEGKK